jgi:hypothetical protein
MPSSCQLPRAHRQKRSPWPGPLIVACRSPRKLLVRVPYSYEEYVTQGHPTQIPPSPTRAATPHSSDRMKTNGRQATTGSVMIALSTSSSCILSLYVSYTGITYSRPGRCKTTTPVRIGSGLEQHAAHNPPPLTLQSTN